MESKIEQELMKATGVKPKKGEDRQDYLKRMAKAVDDMSTKAYDKLSSKAQKWFEECVAASNAGDDLPDFSDKPKPEPTPTPKKGLLRLKNREVPEDEPDEPEAADEPEVIGKGSTVSVRLNKDTVEGIVRRMKDGNIKIELADGDELEITLADAEEEAGDELPTWKEVHRMDADELDALAKTDPDVKKKWNNHADFDSEEAAADWLCKQFGIEPPAKPKAKKQVVKAKIATKKRKQAVKKPAAKKKAPAKKAKRKASKKK